MEQDFKPITPEQITDNVFSLIGTDWMLITAGTREKYNMMTASWGGMGIMWGKKICWCVIRPSRYTFEFVEKARDFTLSFYPEKYRSALNLCGSKSGRDIDKAKASGLTPVSLDSGAIYFKEARLVLECRKIYFQDLVPAQFLDPAIEKNYAGKDYHRLYMGEITGCCARPS